MGTPQPPHTPQTRSQTTTIADYCRVLLYYPSPPASSSIEFHQKNIRIGAYGYGKLYPLPSSIDYNCSQPPIDCCVGYVDGGVALWRHAVSRGIIRFARSQNSSCCIPRHIKRRRRRRRTAVLVAFVDDDIRPQIGTVLMCTEEV